MLKKKNIIITGALGQDGVILSKLLLKKKLSSIWYNKKKQFKKIKKCNLS